MQTKFLAELQYDVWKPAAPEQRHFTIMDSVVTENVDNVTWVYITEKEHE